MRALLIVWVSAILLTAGSAFADPPGAALRSYAAGDYLTAADLAEAQNSPASLAFAARALMAECITAPHPARIADLLDRAENAAREALARDATSVEARLQLAISLGVRGRRTHMADALAHNYAGRGRRLIEEALALAPDNPWAHALMGGWHLEVLRRGGRAGAVMYGARLTSGVAEFDRARALAPNDPLIAMHYAVALIELDAEAHAARAEALLAAAAALQPRDAFEAHALAAARRLARVLETDGPAAAETIARAALL